MSLSSYILAGFLKTVDRSSEASLKYVIYGSVASGIMLFGISILYGLTGTTNLYEMNAILQSASVGGFTFIFAGIMVLGGIGFKVSIAPFHFWTPDVYEGAPIAITAYLSVASKAAGFALLIRFIKVTFFQSLASDGSCIMLNIIDWQRILIALSILTMTLGNFAALWQDNIKRMLAFSSIAHAGYLLLAVAIFSNDGVIAVLVYFAIYLFMNLGAFFVVMLIANKIGSEEMERLADPGPRRATPAPAASISGPAPVPSVPPLRRDPFRFADDEPAVSPEVATSEWAPPERAPSLAPPIRLSGLVRRAGQIRAVLSVPGGPLLLGAGEEAEGYRVLEIDEEAGVRVRLPDGREIKLELLLP